MNESEKKVIKFLGIDAYAAIKLLNYQITSSFSGGIWIKNLEKTLLLEIGTNFYELYDGANSDNNVLREHNVENFKSHLLECL